MAENVKDEGVTDSSITLRRVFSLPEEGVPDKSPDRWKAVSEQISKEVKGVRLPAAMPDLAPKICELFDVKIPDVLLTSWKKVNELQAVLEKSKLKPEEVSYLELAEHTVNSEHKPSIEVKVKDVPVKKIEFVVKLVFKLKGFVLKIQNGSIKEMETGSCEVKGTVAYQGVTILDKKLEAIKLPLSIPIHRSENAHDNAAPTERVEV